jgi:hypothetical protein
MPSTSSSLALIRSDLHEIYLLPDSAKVGEYHLNEFVKPDLPADPKARAKVVLKLLRNRTKLADELPRFVERGTLHLHFERLPLSREVKASLRKKYFPQYSPDTRYNYCRDSKAAGAWLRIEKKGMPGPPKLMVAYELSKADPDQQPDLWEAALKKNYPNSPTIKTLRELRNPQQKAGTPEIQSCRSFKEAIAILAKVRVTPKDMQQVAAVRFFIESLCQQHQHTPSGELITIVLDSAFFSRLCVPPPNYGVDPETGRLSLSSKLPSGRTIYQGGLLPPCTN